MKDRILDTVAELIQRYGLKKFTVDEVAKELKISKKTIYQYFSSKDEMIQEYFRIYVESDKNGITGALKENKEILTKIHAVIFSSHRYKMPVSIIEEARRFYPKEWQNIEDLKHYKLTAIQNLLEQGAREGVLKKDIHFGVLTAMLERISDMATDYDFLIENNLKASNVIEEALNIIFNGIIAG